MKTLLIVLCWLPVVCQAAEAPKSSVLHTESHRHSLRRGFKPQSGDKRLQGNNDSGADNDLIFWDRLLTESIGSMSPEPSLQPTPKSSTSPTDVPSSPPTSNPSTSPSSGPSMSPSKGPSSSPSEEPSSTPSEQPSESPSDLPTPEGVCTGDVKPFEISILLDLEAQPGLATEADILILEVILKDAYNQVALCDQAGAFILVSDVTIDTDFADSFGNNLSTGSNVTTPVTWKVDFVGECRGCPADVAPTLFGNGEDSGNGEGGTCDCEFPLVETYILECNQLIASFGAGLEGFVVTRATPLRILGGSGGSISPTSFSSQVTVGGNGGFISPFDLTIIIQAFIDSYNALNILNFANCDVAERNVISVVPSIDQAPDATPQDPKPFSIVFNIIGTCRGCGTSTVVFGNHAPDAPQDPNVACPVGAVLRCPSEEEFQMALNEAIDRLQQDGLLAALDSINSVIQIPGTPSPTPSPTILPTQAPSGCVDATAQPTSIAAAVDLSSWTAEANTGSWRLSEDRNSVLQTVNGDPTAFCSNFTSFGNELAGVISVRTGFDDDFIGFIIGYEIGDFSNPNADYLLVDWKQNNQNAGGFGLGRRGFAVSRVTGVVNGAELWSHNDASSTNGTIEELARGATLGGAGWGDFVEYEFRFVYTPDRLQVFVDGALEIDISGTFPNGNFCFYNYSQASVRYSGIMQRSVQEPPILCPSSAPSVSASPSAAA